MEGNEHTVHLLDLIVRQSEKHLYVIIVMDYYHLDLEGILNNSQEYKINESHIIKSLYSILCALKFVHSAGVIHRDIKPSNMLVQKGCRFRLCDFGLSRSLPECKNPGLQSLGSKSLISEALLSDRADRKGRKRELSPYVTSRAFRAPEVILLEKEYDEKIDIWSAGCAVLELLNESLKTSSSPSQRHPFLGDSCYPLTPKFKDDKHISKHD